MDAAELGRRMERERLFWVDLAPGKRLQMLRPRLAEGAAVWSAVVAARGNPEALCAYIRDWDGITESDLIAGSTSSEPVEYDKANAISMVLDNAAYANAVGKAMVETIKARADLTTVVEKKPETS